MNTSVDSTEADALREAGLAEYVAWRDRQHASMTLPPTLIASALALAHYDRPVQIARIVAGESSAVFSLEASGESLIVRVKRNGLDALTEEQRVLRAAIRRGVHVPEVVAVDEVVADGMCFAFMIQRPLGTVNFDDRQHGMRAVAQRQVLRDFGADLARLHAVRTASTTPHEWHQHLCQRLDTRVGGILGHRCPSHILELVLNTRDDIAANRRWFALAPVGLSHQDLGMSHVRLDGRRYAGMIDFEYAREADPLFDIAYFGVWASLRQVRAVLDGYGTRGLGADAAIRYRSYRAAIAAGALSQHTRLGLPQSAESIYAAYIRARPEIDAISEWLDDSAG